MTPNRSFLAGLAVVGAFVIGRSLVPEPPVPAVPPERIVMQRSTPGTTVVREIVREREVDRAEPEAPTPVAEEPAPEVAAKREVALSKARTLIASAVHTRRWTSDDARALGEVMPQLGRPEIDEVMTSLIAPINAQQLKVETGGSLFD